MFVVPLFIQCQVCPAASMLVSGLCILASVLCILVSVLCILLSVLCILVVTVQDSGCG